MERKLGLRELKLVDLAELKHTGSILRLNLVNLAALNLVAWKSVKLNLLV